MKKITSALLAMVMVISLSCFGTSAETGDESEIITLDNYQDKIVEAVKESENVTSNNIEIISLDGNLTRSSSSAMAIKISENGVETIIEPKSLVGDELVNTFAYAKQSLMSRSNKSISVSGLVDVNLTFTYYYNYKWLNTYLLNAYTPKQLSMRWTSSNSSVTINNVYVVWQSKGDYWYLPSQNDLGSEKTVRFSIYRNSPQKNTTYSDSANALGDSYGLVFASYSNNQRSYIDYEITYTVNGTRYTDGYEWRVLGT